MTEENKLQPEIDIEQKYKLTTPYYIKFGVFFAIIVAVLVLLELFTASSVEFGTFGLIVTIYPVMAFFEYIGLGKVDWLIIPATLIFLFIIGSLIGLLIQKIKSSII